MRPQANDKEALVLRPTGSYPCLWDDLVDSSGRVVATIYTMGEARPDRLGVGVSLGVDGIFNVVLRVRRIRLLEARKAALLLARETGLPYRFEPGPTMLRNGPTLRGRTSRCMGKRRAP